MRIAIKGRNTPVTDDIRDHVERRFGKIAKQVSICDGESFNSSQ